MAGINQTIINYMHKGGRKVNATKQYCVDCASKNSVNRELKEEIKRLRAIVGELQEDKRKLEIKANRGL